MLRKLSIILLVLSFSMLFFACSSDISGTITYDWAPLGEITVLLSATPLETITTTNTNGVYTFNGLVPGGYTVTPISSSYAFDPASQFVQLTSATSAINIDFEVSEVLVCFDDDGDGYGYPAHESCDHPELDCDDSNEDIHPWGCEILDDGIDQNCDGRDALSSDRFTDNCNGTVTDTLSGLIWLQNANAFGEMNWHNAKAAAATLDEGDFEWLTDGSSEGDWRLFMKLEVYPQMASGNLGYDLFYDVQSYYWTGQDCLDIGLYTWAYLRLWSELKANAMTAMAIVWPLRDPRPDE